MAGTFLIGETKVRPGVYYRREKIGATAAGATNGVLAALFQSNWGELNKVVSIDQTQLNELEDIFGDGSTIIREGLLGGAKTVLAIRVGSDDGVAAKVTLQTVPVEVDIVTPHELICNVEGEDAQQFDVPDNFDYDNFTARSGDVDIEPFITLGEGKITVSAQGISAVTGGKFKLNWNTHSTVTQAVDAVELSALHVGERNFTVSVRTNLITDKRQLLIYSGTDIYTTVNFDAGGRNPTPIYASLTTLSRLRARRLNHNPPKLQPVTARLKAKFRRLMRCCLRLKTCKVAFRNSRRRKCGRQRDKLSPRSQRSTNSSTKKSRLVRHRQLVEKQIAKRVHQYTAKNKCRARKQTS